MNKKYLLLIPVLLFLAACGGGTQNKKAATQAGNKQQGKDSISGTEPFRGIAFASKKDLVCGMPVSAGVHDTCHYKGNIYGFCASECKKEFTSNPAAYLAAK